MVTELQVGSRERDIHTGLHDSHRAKNITLLQTLCAKSFFL